MKVLWFVNIVFPELGKKLNVNFDNSGGWMSQFKNMLCLQKDVNLGIVNFQYGNKSLIEEKIDNIDFFIIPKIIKYSDQYDESVEKYIEKVISSFNPDIVHIWGSEMPHSLSVARVCKKMRIKAVISIQGLIGDYSRHYCLGLPHSVIRSYTIRDLIRRDNIDSQRKKFMKRGIFEQECFSLVNNVIGRTDYDYSVVKEINSDTNYYFCNECLRNAFYANDAWDLDTIERHSIFISQSYYPIKGFHYFLDALVILKDKYPDLTVYVGGGFNPYAKSIKERLRRNSFEKYIANKIDKYNLSNHIVFLEKLSEREMKNRMIKSHVFVSPSLIENSPNSVGEAMILGVPTISSFVGGVANLMQHKKSGLLYPVDQPSMLAKYITDIFEDDVYANFLSINAKEKASVTHNIDTNTKKLLDIYNDIVINN